MRSGLLCSVIKITKKEKILLYSYIYNQRQQLESELLQAQTNIRYRRIDVVDCTELTCTIERLNTFNQVTKDIMNLLRLTERSETEEE